MKIINVSMQKMPEFAGKWVVIDPIKEAIIAVGESLQEIAPLVMHSKDEKIPPVGKAPYSFLVPRKDEGPYVLWVSMR